MLFSSLPAPFFYHQTVRHLALLFFIALFQLTLVEGKRCELYAGTVCAPVYADNVLVYIDNDLETIQSLETKMRLYFPAFAAVDRYSCGPYLLATLCQEFLPTCQYDETEKPQQRWACLKFCPNRGIVVGNGGPDGGNIFMAPSECGSEYDYFWTSYDPARRFRPMCYPMDPQQGAQSGYPGDVRAAEYELKCDSIYNDFVTKYQTVIDAGYHAELPSHPCPKLLAPVPSDRYNITQSPCTTPCPSLSFTEEQYQREDVVIIVMNALSIFCLAILVTSWIVFPALRLQSYVFYYIICISIMTLSLFVLIPIARVQNKTIAASLCSSPTEEYHMAGYPLFQGMVVSFTYMAATAWGFIMVLDIFIQVVIGKHFQKASRHYIIKERIYHVFAWFWGFYSVIGGLASRQIGATVSFGGAYALITPSRFQQAQGMFNGGNPFFYYPLVGLTMLSVLIMVIVLIKLALFKFQAKTTGLKLATFVRLFLFILANTFIICVFLIFSIQVSDKLQELEAATRSFVQCLHENSTFKPFDDPTIYCGSAPIHNLDFNILLLSVALFNGMGLIAFMIYGTTTDLLYSWLGFFYMVFGFRKLKRYEKDYRRNRQSTRVHTTKTHNSTQPFGSRTNQPSGFTTNYNAGGTESQLEQGSLDTSGTHHGRSQVSPDETRPLPPANPSRVRNVSAFAHSNKRKQKSLFYPTPSRVETSLSDSVPDSNVELMDL